MFSALDEEKVKIYDRFYKNMKQFLETSLLEVDLKQTYLNVLSKEAYILK